MTGRSAVIMLALLAAACLDWEPVDDAVTAGEPNTPPLRHLTPAGLPTIFDPGELAERCATVCRKYVECYGPVVDQASCESLCISEYWVHEATDLACFLAAGCSELYLCYGG
jgi:hypothetical protein